MEETLLTKVRPETLEALMSVTSDVVNEIKEAVPDRDDRLRDEHYVENIKSLDPLLYSQLTHQKYIRTK